MITPSGAKCTCDQVAREGGKPLNSDQELPARAVEERDQLIARLTELVRTVSDAELEYISEADPGAGPIRIAKHQAALRTIIFKRDGHMTEKHDFFPGEVLCMIAEDDEEHQDRAFEVATALLLMKALRSQDEDGAMSICWSENWPVYFDVDQDFLEPFMFGFRWLAEYSTDWDYLHDPDVVEPVPDRVEIAELVEQKLSAKTSLTDHQEPPDGLG